MFNTDNLSYTTTSGTSLQDIHHWQHIFNTVCNILIESIDRLTEYAHVHILMVPGNHDREKIFYMGAYLSAWYKNNKNVYVDNTASTRKYFKFGKVLLGFTHGSEEKLSDLPLIMATEEPTKWASTKYREWHLGHKHKNYADENFGVIVRILPSLCSTDSWHNRKGYIGNIKSSNAYLWSKKKGLVSIHQYNVS